MDLAEKIKANTWDNIDDFLKVLKAARTGQWRWYSNPKCKYVELRVDMRDGGCIIKDSQGNRISPEDLAHQYGQDTADSARATGLGADAEALVGAREEQWIGDSTQVPVAAEPAASDDTALLRQCLDVLELSLPAKCGQSDDLLMQERANHRAVITALRTRLSSKI